MSALSYREYSLSGSYRRITHVPQHLEWKHLRYDDPDVPLAQSDEDKILNNEPVQTIENGKFAALQISLTLGSSTYATMALRELTKEDTSAHNQSMLTAKADDQQHKAAAAADEQDGEDEAAMNGAAEAEDVQMNES